MLNNDILKKVVVFIIIMVQCGCLFSQNIIEIIDDYSTTHKMDTIEYVPYLADTDVVYLCIDTMYWENDTLFLSHYSYVDSLTGDTCVMHHFVTPASNSDYQEQLYRIIDSNPFDGITHVQWKSLFSGLAESYLVELHHNDLQDFPRDWYTIMFYQGGFYRTKDFDIRCYYTDIGVFYFGDPIGFRPIDKFDKGSDGVYSYIDYNTKITFYPVINIPNLYLQIYEYRGGYWEWSLVTPTKCLGQFDYIDCQGGCANLVLYYDEDGTEEALKFLIQNGIIQVKNPDMFFNP